MKKSNIIGEILMCLCEIICGILLLINPVGFTSSIIVVFGAILAISGIGSMITYFRADPFEAASGQLLAQGLALLVGGLFCSLRSHWFIATFPLLTILYGIGTLATGFIKTQWAVDAIRRKEHYWGWMALGAALSLLFAVLILSNPFSTTAVLWTFVAISLIVEAVLDLFAVIFGKKAGN